MPRDDWRTDLAESRKKAADKGWGVVQGGFVATPAEFARDIGEGYDQPYNEMPKPTGPKTVQEARSIIEPAEVAEARTAEWAAEPKGTVGIRSPAVQLPAAGAVAPEMLGPASGAAGAALVSLGVMARLGQVMHNTRDVGAQLELLAGPHALDKTLGYGDMSREARGWLRSNPGRAKDLIKKGTLSPDWEKP